MEDAYIIHGGKPLKGKVQLSGAKNIALKIIIAALQFDSEVTLKNIPRIKDVQELLNLIHDLGGKAEFTEKNTLVIDGRTIHKHTVSLLYGSKIRVSFMFFAPLLHKFSKADIPNPGGCRLGARSIDRVIEGIQALGVSVNYDSDETGYYNAELKEKVHGTYTFPKPSHTGTELLIMLSVFAEGTVTLHNVALEPEIDDLIAFLNAGGAHIERTEKSIIIQGISSLKQSEPFAIEADRVEAATYAVAALATKGDVIIHGISEMYIHGFNEKLQQAGAGIEQLSEKEWRFFYKQPLKAVSIETEPYPGFLTDWQPMYAVLMTQAEGSSKIHERIFENRFSYVSELTKLGADIEYCEVTVENPHEYYHFNYDEEKDYQQAICIKGIQELHNGALEVKDLRAGATLAIAALIADGESVVNGISHLERGYEDFVEKVRALGGDVKKV